MPKVTRQTITMGCHRTFDLARFNQVSASAERSLTIEGPASAEELAGIKAGLLTELERMIEKTLTAHGTSTAEGLALAREEN